MVTGEARAKWMADRQGDRFVCTDRKVYFPFFSGFRTGTPRKQAALEPGHVAQCIKDRIDKSRFIDTDLTHPRPSTKPYKAADHIPSVSGNFHCTLREVSINSTRPGKRRVRMKRTSYGCLHRKALFAIIERVLTIICGL